jgi:prevent-host-death family protein
MKRASITEAKNNLSALIDGLRNGSPVLIVDRGRPVARLEPVVLLPEPDADGRVARLVREGLVRPRRAPLDPSSFNAEPAAAGGGASVLEALLEERREGR